MDLSSLQLISVLNHDPVTKYIALHVRLASENHPESVDTIILAEKSHFDDNQALLELGLCPLNERGQVEVLGVNDIYYRLLVRLQGVAHARLTVIHPATPTHFAKYSTQSKAMVRETPELYRSVVQPWIRQQAASRLLWVENILNGVGEQEKVIFREEGFVLLPDSKWDERNLTELYLLFIVTDRSLASMRDLTGEHLPLLRRMVECAHQQIPHRYPGMAANQLRLYVHYQPSYYQFHVHAVALEGERGMAVGQGHLLEDLISLLELDGEIMQRRTLIYSLGCNHALYPLITQATPQ